MGAGLMLGGLIAIRIRARRPMLLATFCVFTFTLPLIALATTLSVPLIALCSNAVSRRLSAPASGRAGVPPRWRVRSGARGTGNPTR